MFLFHQSFHCPCADAGGLQLQGHRVRLLPGQAQPGLGSARRPGGCGRRQGGRVRVRRRAPRVLLRRGGVRRGEGLRRVRLDAADADAGRLRDGQGRRGGQELHRQVVLRHGVRRMRKVSCKILLRCVETTHGHRGGWVMPPHFS